MPTFSIEGDGRTILTRLFEVDPDGHLGLGWGGRSLQPTSLADLLAGPVRFRDYIMEGFLFYTVRVEDRNPGCLLIVQGEGSNRDQYIRPHLRHAIRVAGLNLIAESEE